MKTPSKKGLAITLAAALIVPAIWSSSPRVHSSSHREAPLISQDPALDQTDLYAFVSPENNERVVLIGNYWPLGIAGAGPNFYRFADSGLYAFHIDNDGDAMEDVTYAFKFKTNVKNGNTFLYNTGALPGGENVTQTYDVYRITGKFTGLGRRQLNAGNRIATDLPVAPPVIGEKSQPNYATLKQAAVKSNLDGSKWFAGPVEDPFFVDLNVFDLLNLGAGVDSLKGTNVQSIAFEIPAAELTNDQLSASKTKKPVIGVWGATYRQNITVRNEKGSQRMSGRWVQVSRLGMPLVNEVVVPLAAKDYFNASHPHDDAGKNFEAYGAVVTKPELAGLFKAVLGLDVPTMDRQDLVTVFLTGVPDLNQPADVRPAEMLRLNVSIKPSTNPHRLGVFGGDTAGFPNGRRLADDVTDIAIQAVAGKLVEGYTVPEALGDGVDANDKAFSNTFPYLAMPNLATK